MRELLVESVVKAGGTVQAGRYVTAPGIFLTQGEAPASPELREIAALWDVDPTRDTFHLMAECSALVTYLNPKKRSPGYVQSVLDKGHLSIAGQSFQTLGLFGVPLETVIELLSHGLDSTARLTSSAVMAMDDPLFCVYGPDELRPLQIENLERLLEVRAQFDERWRATDLSPIARRELRNSLWPGSRATFLFMGMRLIDWAKLLAKRLPRAGNEAMLRVICRRIAALLHERFPQIVNPPESYGWDGDPWR